MKRVRHNFVSLSDEFIEIVEAQLRIAVDNFLPSETKEVFIAANHVTFKGGRKLTKQILLLDRLETATSLEAAELVRKTIERPLVLERRDEFSEFGIPDYEFIHLTIALDMTGRNFFFSENQNSQLVFLSLNILTTTAKPEAYRMLKHYLETEIREEYLKHIYLSLVEAARLSENSVEFSDPSELFLVYIDELQKRLPDIDIAYWRLVGEGAFLQCDACSDPTFDCDVLEPDHELIRASVEGKTLHKPSLSKAKSSEETSPNVYFASYENGWRSARFRSIAVGRKPAGTLAVFTRYPGGVPDLYNQLIDFLYQQTARFVAEKNRLSDLLSLKAELKKLVPLLAVGNEVLQRNHDIRDQISVVRSNLISIRDGANQLDPSRIEKRASSALSSIQRMTDVLSKQLQGFKSARDARRSVLLSELVGEVKERMSVIAGIENVDFNVNVHSDTKVRVQRSYIERVLENVFGNAVYFSKQTIGENVVDVQVTHDPETASVVVTDNGPGISQSPVEKVFELGETTKPDGYGIGLAIASEILESHGGKITARNLQGTGAVFVLQLPVANI